LNIADAILYNFSDIIYIFLTLMSIIILEIILIFIANLRRKKLAEVLYYHLGTHSEKNSIDKIIEQQTLLSQTKNREKELENQNNKLKKIAEINQKASDEERNINKELAKNLDFNLRKIIQLTSNSINNFNNGVSMSIQMIESILTNIKDSAAKLLLLRNIHSQKNTNTPINIKNCLIKSLTIFDPRLFNLECKVDLYQLQDDLVYNCIDIPLIQMFSGLLDRLLFSMEKSEGNYIRVKSNVTKDSIKITFENSSLGIFPSIDESIELVSSCLAIPNWISTKAIAKSMDILIQESMELSKGDIIELDFPSSNLKRHTHGSLHTIS
jgi:hypothetical protein